LSFQAPKEPLIFLKGPQHLRPSPQTAVPRLKHMHYECELAVAIGRLARNVTRSDAYQYVAGYTVANDYAIRDYLENYYRPNFRVKSRDSATPLAVAGGCRGRARSHESAAAYSGERYITRKAPLVT